ncbi:hypothetical protein [Tumebacillus lipolyticus]|uniref:Yip1 domain-containing protein n=1 Tax=Tumebacillus lipolyticus TaxID=1280370 RepID=A0ABW5A0U7_9BACL
MKSFLRIFPYILVFIVVLLLQVKLDADNRVLPYLEPYGRETVFSTTTPNRPVQVLGDNRYAWLSGTELVIGSLNPAKQTTELERRPLPAQDIYTTTTFKLSGSDLYWVGEKRVLKHASWQNGAWSPAKTFDTGLTALDLVQVGGQQYLLVGTEKGLKIYQAVGSQLTEVRSYQTQRAAYVKATLDARGIVHIGLIEQLGMESYMLNYLTLDAGQNKATDLQQVKQLSVGTSNLIDDSTFGIDETHGYYLMTYKSSRKSTTELRAVSFPLNQPSPETAQDMKLIPDTAMGEAAPNSSAAYVRPVQENSLQFAFVADYAKNPRISGKEVFLSTLQGGQWTKELQRVSNSNGLGSNPVFDKQGDVTTFVYAVFAKLNTYDVLYNSNDPAYMAETNKIGKSDYTRAAMEVPRYLGMSIMILVIGFAWPMLPFGYLFFYLFRKEDALYEQPNRHLFISVLLYLATQIVVFLEYGNLDALYSYSPEWMHSSFMVSMLFVVMAVISYGFTALYARTRYERSALGEFSYFLGINLWIVILTLSYYMAG